MKIIGITIDASRGRKFAAEVIVTYDAPNPSPFKEYVTTERGANLQMKFTTSPGEGEAYVRENFPDVEYTVRHADK